MLTLKHPFGTKESSLGFEYREAKTISVVTINIPEPEETDDKARAVLGGELSALGWNDVPTQTPCPIGGKMVIVCVDMHDFDNREILVLPKGASYILGEDGKTLERI
jgi:hypothetical protein